MNKLSINNNGEITTFMNVQDYDIIPMIVENGFGVIEEVKVIAQEANELQEEISHIEKKLKLNEGVTYEVISLQPEIEAKENKKKKLKKEIKDLDIDKITTVKDLKQAVKMLIERLCDE
jgi:hypothetical protein